MPEATSTECCLPGSLPGAEVPGTVAVPQAPQGAARPAVEPPPAAAPPAAQAAAATTSRLPRPFATLRERAILRKLRRGDPRAFAQLVREHQDRVFDLVFRMLGDREEALDLSQEVFVSIHAALPRFRGDSQLSTWIFRVTRNHCLNRLKYLGRRSRNRTTEISEVPESVLEAQQPSRKPDEALDEGERRDRVQRAIAQLDEEHRLLVLLRDVEGLSYHEIAAITEQPEGTVKSRLHRARAALAQIIAGLEEE